MRNERAHHILGQRLRNLALLEDVQFSVGEVARHPSSGKGQNLLPCGFMGNEEPRLPQLPRAACRYSCLKWSPSFDATEPFEAFLDVLIEGHA